MAAPTPIKKKKKTIAEILADPKPTAPTPKPKKPVTPTPDPKVKAEQVGGLLGNAMKLFKGRGTRNQAAINRILRKNK